tara:strand:- start:4486 stop:5787 length:1302 start_codon:yes stop_codon:yes gene_type:complete
MKNLQYKDKYLKYKNKYYKIKKNIKGGNIEVYTIIALILGIIGSGIYLYKTDTDNKLDLDNKLETYSSITNKLNIDIQNYFNILNELINNKNSLDLYKKLYKFFKYEHIDIHNFYKINKEKIDESFNELIILFSKLKNETPILTLINLEKDNLLKDSFIYSFKSSIIENVSFDESIRRDIEKMSYIEIRNELINYIEQQKLYDVYFLENLNINKLNTDKNDISLAELKEKANEKNTQDNKKRFIEFMKLNNNIVSDFPMIHAASDKYNIYIVLLVNFKNTRYFKLYKPINIKEPASIKNTIVLNYSNYCDFNCDFMNNENIHTIVKNINTNAISINSELLKSNNNNNNISNLYNINKDNLNMNFEWADKDDNKFLKITEINFFNNKYNNTNSNINNISQQNNLSYNEKNEINKELNIRPWYQYYKFNYNMKPY